MFGKTLTILTVSMVLAGTNTALAVDYNKFQKGNSGSYQYNPNHSTPKPAPQPKSTYKPYNSYNQYDASKFEVLDVDKTYDPQYDRKPAKPVSNTCPDGRPNMLGMCDGAWRELRDMKTR